MLSLYPIWIKHGRIENEHCEINVAEHCNLACKSCSHQSPLMRKRFADAGRVYDDLKALAPVYHVRRVSLLGGEPLLHPDLPSIIDAARRSGVGDCIGLVTNGVLLPRMPEECWAALDEVRVSVYPGFELEPEEQAACRALARKHDVRLDFHAVDTFFEAYAARGTQDRRLVQRIYDTCTIAHEWRCHLVTDGHFYKCPHAYFLAKTLARPEAHGDGLPISTDASFQKRLLEYLRSPTPLRACTHCLGTAGKRFTHRQEGRRSWAELQEDSSESLIDASRLAEARRYTGVQAGVRALLSPRRLLANLRTDR